MKYWIIGILCILASQFSSLILMMFGIGCLVLGICKLMEDHLPESIKNYVSLF